MYFYDMKGKLVNAITSGKFTVTDLTYVDERERRGLFYSKEFGKYSKN